MATITGLHHVTVNSGDPQENVDFYVGVLGMRLVKRSVNQDAPDTYHFFYADGEGNPGTELTFFPWAGMPAGRRGVGETGEVALAVPPGSLDFWAERLAGLEGGIERATRFGESVLAFRDPHGLGLALVETADTPWSAPWSEGPVPARFQIRGLHAVRISERALDATAAFLERGLGFAHVGEEDGWHRYAVAGGGSGRIVDVKASPDAPAAVQGAGSVHHVAFRVPDDDAERRAQRELQAAGARPTQVIDRFWFKSIYFREPGGALFEIATDGPGFAVDEEVAMLGEKLILPPFLEPHRPRIERMLRPVTVPAALAAGAEAAGGRA